MSFSMGGKNLAYFFRFKLKTDKSGYDLLEKLTDVAASPAAPTSAALVIKGDIESTKVDHQDDGTVQMEFTQYEAEDVYAYLDKVAVPTSTKKKPDVTLEDGIVKTSSSQEYLDLAVSYLFADDDDNPTKCMVYCVPCSIDKTSGSFETKGDAYVAPTLKAIGVAVPIADLVIPKEVFDTDIVTAPAANITIAKGKPHHRAYLTVAA